MCSTPFGVTVFCTSDEVVRLSVPTHVLNAFRRHCVLHMIVQSGTQPPDACSTPFGVTVFCTLVVNLDTFRSVVLNAFRRHCVLHNVLASYSSSPDGAQRL